MAAMSDAQPSKLNLWMDFLATTNVDETSAPLLPHAVRASLYIGAVWIRLPKELNMKRLLLVMGTFYETCVFDACDLWLLCSTKLSELA